MGRRCRLPGGRARLAVLAGEVGGGWSPETMSFLSQRQRVQSRRQAILSCAAAKALAGAVGDARSPGADGDTPASHVLRDFQFFCRVGLSTFVFSGAL